MRLSGTQASAYNDLFEKRRDVVKPNQKGLLRTYNALYKKGVLKRTQKGENFIFNIDHSKDI